MVSLQSLSPCVCVRASSCNSPHGHQLNSRVDTHVVCCVVRLYIFLLAFSDTKYTNLSVYKTNWPHIKNGPQQIEDRFQGTEEWTEKRRKKSRVSCWRSFYLNLKKKDELSVNAELQTACLASSLRRSSSFFRSFLLISLIQKQLRTQCIRNELECCILTEWTLCENSRKNTGNWPFALSD